MERLVAIAASGKYDLGRIVSHRLPLSEGPRAYDLFDRKLDGCTKVLLRP
jgi:threonine dehydrogenase-like Zn-dependent dehydrogenase